MLVIISDIHLTDETTCRTLDPGAFRIFAERLQDLAVRASWRSDGGYRPLTGIDVLLLGDALDLIRSSVWQGEGPKPWDDTHGHGYVQRVAKVLRGTLSHNVRSLAILKALSVEQIIRLPESSPDHKPDFEGPQIPVPVRVHYMVGNTDWMLHNQGESYRLIRQVVCDELGLANDPAKPFPHQGADDPVLADILARHRVCARHGDQWDPLSYSGRRDQSSLSDVLAIELITYFRDQVEATLGDQLPASTRLGLSELDHVRPLAMAPLWLDQLLRLTCPVDSLQYEIRGQWDRAVRRMLDLKIVRDGQLAYYLGSFDELAQLMMFQGQIATDQGEQLAAWIAKSRGGRTLSLVRNAMHEPEFRNRRARHFVYGHTHVAETVPLDASFMDGYVLNQIYFNSGTWRRTYHPTGKEDSPREFLPAEAMSYLTFYADDERHGAPYEVWSGILGTAPSPIRRIRVDGPQQALKPSKAFIAAGEQKLARPHFLSGAAAHSIPKPPAAG
ncbi:MAG: hypothetical protein WD045_05055 [Pirellulaceae bacterium]